MVSWKMGLLNGRNKTTMRLFAKILSTVIACLMLSSYALAGDDVAAHIQKQNAKYEAAYNRGDADAVAALHTKDARVMVSGLPTSVGTAAIRSGIAAETSGSATLTINLETVKLDVTPTTAYEKGRWTTLVQEQGKRDETIGGHYLVIWKKIGREWLIDFDAVFSD